MWMLEVGWRRNDNLYPYTVAKRLDKGAVRDSRESRDGSAADRLLTEAAYSEKMHTDGKGLRGSWWQATTLRRTRIGESAMAAGAALSSSLPWVMIIVPISEKLGTRRRTRARVARSAVEREAGRPTPARGGKGASKL